MRFLILCTLLALTACQQQTPPAAEAFDQTQIESEIAQVVDDIILGAEATDIDALEVHWLDEASLVNVGHQFTKADLVASFRTGFATLESQDITAKSSNITVLSADAAIASVDGVFTSTTKEGVTSPERSFGWTYVFVKRDGTWRILQSHQSFGSVN